MTNGESKKGLDQDFLKDFIWKYAQKNATIHDSYSCKEFGGDPFPTKRPESFCYISCHHCCENIYKNKTNYECPLECRPKEHLDWTYC